MTTINELVEHYLRERSGLGHLNELSAGNRRNQLMLMTKSFPTTDPDAITAPMIRTWLMTGAHGEALKPRTVALRTVMAKHFFQWCVDNDYLVKSPARRIEAPKIMKGAPRFLEIDEVQRLCAVVTSPRDLALVLLMVQCGLRRVEIHRSDVVDLDLGTARIALRGKGYRGEISRHVPLPAEAASALHRWMELHPGKPALFCSDKSDRLSLTLISRVVSDYMRTAGVKIKSGDGRSAHALRHSFAQHLVDSNVNLRIIQAALGHQSITTTETYLKRHVDVMGTALEGRKYTAA